MRPSTSRFASAASLARSTVIPLPSRAAAALSTAGSLAMVPNRRLTDRSSSGLSSVIIWLVLRCVALLCLQLQIPYAHLVAHASTFGTGGRGPARRARVGGAPRPPRTGGLALAAAGARHADASAGDRPRA